MLKEIISKYPDSHTTDEMEDDHRDKDLEASLPHSAGALLLG